MEKKQKFPFARRIISLLISGSILIYTVPSATNATDLSPPDSEAFYDDSGGDELEETFENTALDDSATATPENDTDSISVNDTDDNDNSELNTSTSEAPAAIDLEQYVQSSQAAELFNLSALSGDVYSVVVTNENGEEIYNETHAAGEVFTLTGKNAAVNNEEAGSHIWSSDNEAATVVKLQSNYTGRYGTVTVAGAGKAKLTHEYLRNQSAFLSEYFYVTIEVPTSLSINLPDNNCNKAITITNSGNLLYQINTEASAVNLPLAELTGMAAGEDVNIWISYEDGGVLFYFDSGTITLSGTVNIDASTGYSVALDHINIKDFAASTIDIGLDDVYFEQPSWSVGTINYTDAANGQPATVHINNNTAASIFAVRGAPLSFGVTVDGELCTYELNVDSTYPENTYYPAIFDDANAVGAAFGLEPQTVAGLDGEYYNISELNVYNVAQAANGFILNFYCTAKPVNHTTLQITKNVSGLHEGDYEFAFVVSDDAFYINMFSLNVSVDADGSGSANHLIRNIEPGSYIITEIGDYKTAGGAQGLVWAADTSNDSTAAEIAFNDNASVTINNNYRERVTSGLIISKSVSYDPTISFAPPSDSFEFSIEINGLPYSGDYAFFVSGGGKSISTTSSGSITLKSGESIMIDGIDTGSTYIVTENLSDGQKQYYTSALENAAGTLGEESSYIYARSYYFNSLTTAVSGNLLWLDDEGNDLVSGFACYPASVTVQLCVDGIATSEKVDVTAEKWAYSFTNLPRYNADGSEIIYSIKETEIHYAADSGNSALLDGDGFAVYRSDSGAVSGMWHVVNDCNIWIPARNEGNGSFKVYLNDGSKPLSGAVFTLDGRDEETAADGYATFDNLPSGTYRLAQTAAPDGYITDSTIWTVTVGDGGSLVNVQKDEGSGIWTNFWSWLVKVISGDSGNLLEDGSVLAVINTRETADLSVALEVTGIAEELQPDLTVTLAGIDGSITEGVLYQLKRNDANYAGGTWTISDLPTGQYMVSQNGAELDAYELTSEYQELLDISASGGAVTIKNTYTEKLSGRTYYTSAELVLNTVGDDGRYLNGAGFAVYASVEDAEAELRALTTVSTENGGKASLIFGGDGIMQSGMGTNEDKNQDVQFSFFIKEISVPTGYSAGGTIHEIIVAENYRTSLSEDGNGFFRQYTYSITSIDESSSELGGLSIVNHRQTGSVTVTKNYSGVTSLPDAFSLCLSGSDAMTEGNTYTLALDNAEFSNEEYIWRLNSLPTGNYAITELRAEISGYSLAASYMVDGKITRVAEVCVGTDFAFTVTNTYTKILVNDSNSNNINEANADISDSDNIGNTSGHTITNDRLDAGNHVNIESFDDYTETSNEEALGGKSPDQYVELLELPATPAGLPNFENQHDDGTEPVDVYTVQNGETNAKFTGRNSADNSDAGNYIVSGNTPTYSITDGDNCNYTSADYSSSAEYASAAPETADNAVPFEPSADSAIPSNAVSEDQPSASTFNEDIAVAAVAGALGGGVAGSVATLIISSLLKKLRRNKIGL